MKQTSTHGVPSSDALTAQEHATQIAEALADLPAQLRAHPGIKRLYRAAVSGVTAGPAPTGVPDLIARDVEQCESADRWNEGVPFKSRWERKLYESGFSAGWDRARAVEAERTSGVRVLDGGQQ